MPLVRTMSLALGCIGLRGRLCLAAAALLVAQGVTTISVARLAHGGASLCRHRASGDTAARGSEADDFDRGPSAADGSSLCWFDAVLADEADGATASTWWDLLLCESAQ